MTEVTSSGRDQGIDIVAHKSDIIHEKAVIQAKCYAEGNNVGRPSIQQYNTLQQEDPDTDKVIVVTSSKFTSEADKLAGELGVKTVDGDELADACIEHFSERFLSENLLLSPERSVEKSNEGNTESTEEISTDDLTESELDLAKLFELYFERLNMAPRKSWFLLFNVEKSSIDTSAYVVDQGTIHELKFPSKSTKLLTQLQKTGRKYGWDVSDPVAYNNNAVGVEEVVPLEEGNMFHVKIDTSNESDSRDTDVLSPSRQAKIVSLMINRVFGLELSGLPVTLAAPNASNESHSRTLK